MWMIIELGVKSSLRLLSRLEMKKAENLTDRIFLIFYFKIVIYIMFTRFQIKYGHKGDIFYLSI